MFNIGADQRSLNKYRHIFNFIFIVSRGLKICLPDDTTPSFPDHSRLNTYQNLFYFHMNRLALIIPQHRPTYFFCYLLRAGARARATEKSRRLTAKQHIVLHTV